MKIKNIDIVIPCYNPVNNWVNTLLGSKSELDRIVDYNFRFIIVNDGSTSGISLEDIKLLNEDKSILYLSYKTNKGKGYAIRKGMEKSNSEITLFTDIDFPYGIYSMVEMIEGIDEGTDLVLSLRDTSYYNNINFSRKLISKFLKYCIKTIFKISHSDTQGGLKAMSKRGKQILLSTTINRYLFDLEFVKLCTKENLKISGIKCQLKPEIELSSVSLKVLIKESINFIKILRI